MIRGCKAGLRDAGSLVTDGRCGSRAAPTGQLALQHSVPLAELQAAAAQARVRQEVLDTISKPWEAKPWHRYRPLFVAPERIRDGSASGSAMRPPWRRPNSATGCPPALIVAIIGIETFYGRQMGRHPVLDSLYTLGFHYPNGPTSSPRSLPSWCCFARE